MQLEATAELRDPEMNPAKKALLGVRPSLGPTPKCRRKI